MWKKMLFLFVVLGLVAAAYGAYGAAAAQGTVESRETSTPYTVVDTGQTVCYDNQNEIACPAEGQAFSGQDAQHEDNRPSYSLSTDGLTVYDNNTGLTWQQSPDLDGDGHIDAGDKLTFSEAQAHVATLNAQNFGGYADWRLPSIKELYSLIDFSGYTAMSATASKPYIDTDYFAFAYGDESAGERFIDAQYCSSTEYVGTVLGDQASVFGVNFADGRIKGYPSGATPGGTKTYYVRYVRGNLDYGQNDFVDNGDGTITDQATGLMWMQADSGATMNWEEALAYAESFEYAGYEDWRLPNAKELQSIVDYARAPDARDPAQVGPAIDPIFDITSDDSYFWTSTTHVEGPQGDYAAYVAFGEAWGWMEQPPGSGNHVLLDVHGAGAQRSDPKSGDPADYPYGHGPQGDVIRIDNYVRLVRDAGPATEASHSTYLPLLTDNQAGEANSSDDDGYTLLAPLDATTTYLIDGDGRTVYTWDSTYRPGNAVSLLENGNLLRTGNSGPGSLNGGGAGGIVEEITPDGTVAWTFEYANSQHRLHHDVEPLPDGNVLAIAWELKTEAQALDAGRDPALLTEGELWPDTVVEIDPDTGSIVWEWHVWDHLVQDQDAVKDNYGVVADHPELIDLNYSGPGAPRGGADWTHINAIDYNADLDQILLSVRNFSEIWIVDHSTTTAEAAGHSGGAGGMGGDLLYRWGNPAAHDAGDSGDRQLYVQHDAHWIPASYPGEGHILVFNNGTGRPGGNYSSVDEIAPPVDGQGHYASSGPSAPVWTYIAGNPTDFYAANISGAQRLADGNTLICDGPQGHLFEVTPEGDVVWEYESGSHIFRATRYVADYAGLPAASEQSAVTARTTGIDVPAAPPADEAQPPTVGQSPDATLTHRPDLAAAAQKLGVTVDALRAALGEPGQGPPDLAAAARQLGVTVEALQTALGLPGRVSPPE